MREREPTAEQPPPIDQPDGASAAPTASGWRRRWPWIGLALALGGLALHAAQYRFVTDDAYITFRYSWNFAFHNQIAFNLGERVEGYTNFLWMLLLGLFLKLRLRPDVMALVLAWLAAGAVVVLIYTVTRIYRGGRVTPWDLLGAILLPLLPSFAVWCGGGLETQLFTALVMGGVTLYLAEQAGRVRRRASGVLFALSAMTRPEGLLVFGLTGLHRLAANLIGERRLWPTRRELWWVAGFFVPFGVYFAWRYAYYGYPFPNTYYVKAGGDGWVMAEKWGLAYLWDFVRENGLLAIAPFVLLFRPRPAREPGEGLVAGMRPAFVWSYVALLVLPYTGYVIWVGGDFMTMGRFFAPLLPLIAFFAQEAMRETLERPRRTREGGLRRPDSWRWSRFVPLVVALLVAGSYNSVRVHAINEKLAYYRWGLDPVAYLDKFASDRIKIGKWMRRNLPNNTYLSVGGAGAIVYASRFRALDSFGLNDLWIAHEAPRHGNRPGHSKSAPLSYILKQKPDLMCHRAHHQDYPYRPPPGEKRYWRDLGYHWVCLDPPGLRPRFYCCLKRIDRELGPFPRVDRGKGP